MATPQVLTLKKLDLSPLVAFSDADAARVLVGTIARKIVHRDLDERGWARLYSPFLKENVGPRYARVAKRLIDAGVLRRAPYRKGRSFGYRLTDDMMSCGPLVHRPLVNPDVIGRVLRARQREEVVQRQRRLPVDDALEVAQRKLTILPEVESALALLPPETLLGQRVVVDRIRSGRLPYSVSSTGRRFNAFSGLKRDLRQYVRLAGEALGYIDITASQPSLLGLLLEPDSHTIGVQGVATLRLPVRPGRILPVRAGGRGSPVSPAVAASELDRLAALAAVGGFYDWLSGDCDLPRSVVKKRFLVDVLAKDRFGHGDYPSAVEDVFRQEFSSVSAAIDAINREDHGHLIRLLQRIEAWLVVEVVAPRLVEHVPIVTLHDAIFCRQRDLEVVDFAFEDAFGEIGFWIKTKRELWGPTELISVPDGWHIHEETPTATAASAC